MAKGGRVGLHITLHQGREHTQCWSSGTIEKSLMPLGRFVEHRRLRATTTFWQAAHLRADDELEIAVGKKVLGGGVALFFFSKGDEVEV